MQTVQAPHLNILSLGCERASAGRKRISKFLNLLVRGDEPSAPLLAVYQSQFFRTLFLIFLTFLRGQCEVLALAGCTTRV